MCPLSGGIYSTLARGGTVWSNWLFPAQAHMTTQIANKISQIIWEKRPDEEHDLFIFEKKKMLESCAVHEVITDVEESES